MSVQQFWRWKCDACGRSAWTYERVLPDGWWMRSDDEAHRCPHCDAITIPKQEDADQ